MEKLSKKLLSQHLKRDFMFFESINSTFDNHDCDIIIAREQTAGIGRHGHSFFSPVGGIYFTVKTDIKPLLTINTAAGIMKALQKIGIETRVKWVNDIFLVSKSNNQSDSDNIVHTPPLGAKTACGGSRACPLVNTCHFASKDWEGNRIFVKKVCGILAKTEKNYALVGVGINYAIPCFPKELASIATSLRDCSKGINSFAALAINEVFCALKGNNLEFYKDRLLGIGNEITLPWGEKAIMKGINNDGNLIYLKDNQEKILTCGDIII